MDQTPAQPIEEIQEVPVSPFKKYLPIILVIVLILLILLAASLALAPSQGRQEAIPTPSPRPTATPFPPPTIPLVTPTPATAAATIVPVKLGRLSFIKNGNIYNSDLATYSLLVKNATPAADKLSWSTLGNFLSWRDTSLSATPSAMTVYNKENKVSFSIKPSSDPVGELIDYAWAPDEKQIAVLYADKSHHIDLFKIGSSSAQMISLLTRSAIIKQILWSNDKSVLFSGEDGINVLDITTGTPELLVDNNQVLGMSLSPDNSKLLVSIGTDKKSDLFVIKLDGSGSVRITPIPAKVDMGTTNLPDNILNNGFIPYALWFPKGDQLLVGYHYLTNLPLVGIYDLTNDSFTAISAFAFYANDIMIDDLRLMGGRVNLSTESPSWQISFFTLEDNAKLAVVRVIPSASSPTFFGNDLLPSGNVF